jgi:signal transduction histidine kinase
MGVPSGMTAAGFFFFGLGAGMAVAAGAASYLLRRHLRRVRAAERRARTAERLAEVGSLTSGLAHEIKNPLSTIGLNAQLLAEGIGELDVPEDAKGRLTRRVDSLRRETERLRGILTDFLEYAGELRLDPKVADINELVSELVDFFVPQCEKSGVRLRADLSPVGLRATVDTPHLKQAVLNLMLNAVQAMSGPRAAEGGGTSRELILKTAAGRNADGYPTVLVHVIDTGPGIDAAARAKLFTPYFTTKPGGTGLGLPATRRIVEAHHGRIDVHTDVGRGTDFVIVLPAEREDRVSEPIPAGGVPGQTSAS